MTMLAAAALPVIAPAMQNRQVREGARIVNGFLTGARNRAMQTGRPVGVVFERMQGLPEACVTLSYAEVPPPYTGDLLGSHISTANIAGPGWVVTGLNPVTVDPMSTPPTVVSQDVGWNGLVRVGDLIKFNYIGHTFRLTGAIDPNTNGPVQPALDPSTNTMMAGGVNAAGYYIVPPGNGPSGGPYPPCAWTFVATDSTGSLPAGGNLKYQIFRAPIRMAAGSVQLPGTTVIDLTCSGFDNMGLLLDNSNGTPVPLSSWVSSQTFQPLPATLASGGATFSTGAGAKDTSNVTLTFGPSGAVDRVWCWQFANNSVVPYSVTMVNPTPSAFRPTQAIHLMVGQREYLPMPPAPPAITDPNANGFKPFLNWQDVGNFWVTINPQSGLVTTTEVLQAPSFTIVTGTPPQYGAFGELISSRKLARDASSMGGR